MCIFSTSPRSPLGLPYQAMLDRCVLSILALFIALSVLVLQVDGGQVTRRSLATGLVLAAMFGAYTVATVHDLFAWRRVRWEACSDLMARRVNGVEVPADQIGGGFEFNNQIPNERTIYTTSVNGDLVAEADAQARPYAVAFSELPGFETLEHRGHRSGSGIRLRRSWFSAGSSRVLEGRRAGLAATPRRPRSRPGQTPSEIYRHYLELPPWPLPWVAKLAFLFEHGPALRGLLRTGTSLFAVARRPRDRSAPSACLAKSPT